MLRPRVARRSLDVALLCAIAAIAASQRADAVVPEGSARFVSHDHAKPGDGWHVELTVARDSAHVRRLVLHDERCGATVLARNVPIGPDGAIDAGDSFTSRGRRGTWRLQVAFPDPSHAEGTFRLSAGGCTGPARTFSANAGGHHGGSAHRHHSHLSGTRPGRYPDLSRATPARRAQARRLWRASVRAARGRFATYRRARRLGFRPLSNLNVRRPQLFHLRHGGYAAMPGSFDARRPESLVYWRPVAGSPVLIAFMYRMPAGPPPRYARPLLGWHSHRRGASQMTHVWLTGTLRTALANCMPVAALEAAIPRFRFDPAGRPGSAESTPCPKRATAASATVRVGDNWFVRKRGVPTVTVRRGQAVTWRFVGREPHNVRAAGGPVRFTSPTRDRGTYRRRMTRAGTYRIVCTIHGGRDQSMRLVVR